MWAGGPNESDGLRASGATAMAVLGLCALAMFLYLTPLSYASDPAPELYYMRARVASVECWFNPQCWATVKRTELRDARASGWETNTPPVEWPPPPPPPPPPSPPSVQIRASGQSKETSVTADSWKVKSTKGIRKRRSEAPLSCVDDDRLLSTAVGKPISCFVVKEADMCDVLLGTPAEGACGCSCG